MVKQSAKVYSKAQQTRINNWDTHLGNRTARSNRSIRDFFRQSLNALCEVSQD